MHGARRQRTLRRLREAAPLIVAAAVIAGCSTHPAPPISAQELQTTRNYADDTFTVYWAGRKLDGVPLTATYDLTAFDAGIGFTFYYGNCLSRGTFHTEGCTLPLKITTQLYSPHSDASFGPQHWQLVTPDFVPAVVYGGGDDVEIYTDRQAIDIVAATPKLANDAVAALRTFNRTPTKSFPAFPKPYYQPNPSQASLNAVAAGTTAATGVTGATSGIGPPSQLEPVPTSGN